VSQVAAARAEPARLLPVAAIFGSFAVFAVATAAGRSPAHYAPLVLLAVVGALAGHRMLAWRTLLTTTILIILWIPIRRYELPSSLPFKLEPYRIFVVLISLGWIASLLVDRRVKLRRSIVDAPILTYLLVAAASVFVNASRLDDPRVSDSVWKSLTFLISFVLLLYLLVSVVQEYKELDALVRVLVGGGAVVAFFGVLEARFHFNVFNHLDRVLPGLHLVESPDELALQREGHVRVLASAQHPIALSAMLVALIPLAIYLAHSTRRRRWWLATGVLALGALSTLSRTGVIMLAVIGLVYLWLRPVAVRRLWPLVLPGLIAVHFALPGTLGSFKDLFFPKGGLVAEQSAGRVGSSRGASLGPGLHIVAVQPVLGQGYATRLRGVDDPNAFIVDDQWLGTAMETGIAGVLAWIWLFGRAIRRTAREAKRDLGDRGWLLTGITASIASFAVGMTTYDAFSFIQVTFVLYILLAFASVALRLAGPPARLPSG
jgi:hypothetical protein